jgi:hypothetical protein
MCRLVQQAVPIGVLAYARSQGARVLEGYPFDTAGINSTHRGHSTLFKEAGFRRQGRRWALELDRPDHSRRGRKP